MISAKSAGRTIGFLFLLQATAGAVSNFALLGQVISTPPGFLTNAAASALQISLAAMLGIAAGLVSMGISITAWPVFMRHSERMAIWFVALSVAALALAAVESGTVLSMLSLSQEYVKAEPAEMAALQSAAIVVRSARTWAHYTNLLVAGTMMFVMYSTLFRFSLVPRLLAGLGLVGTVLQLIAVTMPIFGYRINFLLLAPIGLSQLALSLWLIARGFDDTEPEQNVNG